MPNKNQNITNIDAILGTCVASVGMESFILTKGAGSQDDIDARCALIMQTVESGSMPDYEKQKYKERIARFKAGIGTITIFAPTDVQQTSIRTRVDDAVCAVRSANEEGIVAGGGGGRGPPRAADEAPAHEHDRLQLLDGKRSRPHQGRHSRPDQGRAALCGERGLRCRRTPTHTRHECPAPEGRYGRAVPHSERTGVACA